MPSTIDTGHLNNEPSGSVVPLACEHSKGVWPTCYGYIRGNNPSDERKLLMRANMVHYCETHQLHLARIFHDWGVTPNRLDYPGLMHAIDHTAEPGTHMLLLCDLDFVTHPSRVLAALSETILQSLPGIKVCCFVDERAFEGLPKDSRPSL